MSGWLYDKDSGQCLGPCSDEMEEKFRTGSDVQTIYMHCNEAHRVVRSPSKLDSLQKKLP